MKNVHERILVKILSFRGSAQRCPHCRGKYGPLYFTKTVFFLWQWGLFYACFMAHSILSPLCPCCPSVSWKLLVKRTERCYRLILPSLTLLSRHARKTVWLSSGGGLPWWLLGSGPKDSIPASASLLCSVWSYSFPPPLSFFCLSLKVKTLKNAFRVFNLYHPHNPPSCWGSQQSGRGLASHKFNMSSWCRCDIVWWTIPSTSAALP